MIMIREAAWGAMVSALLRSKAFRSRADQELSSKQRLTTVKGLYKPRVTIVIVTCEEARGGRDRTFDVISDEIDEFTRRGHLVL